MTDVSADANVFWSHYKGNVRVLANLEWKKGRSTGLYALEAAQDEAGSYYARLNVRGEGFYAFGPERDLRRLTKDVMAWAREQGALWQYTSPGTFLPEALRGELSAAGVTNSALAEQLRVGDNEVREWIAGRGEPTREQMQRICEILGVFPSDLARSHRG
jgi:hypothetical protein